MHLKLQNHPVVPPKDQDVRNQRAGKWSLRLAWLCFCGRVSVSSLWQVWEEQGIIMSKRSRWSVAW